MTFSQHLLNRLKAAYDGASDYRIAKILGVTHQCVSHVNTGRNGFNDENLIKIADLLGENRVNIVARAHISDDSSHDIRMLWGEILRLSDAAHQSNVIEFKGKASA